MIFKKNKEIKEKEESKEERFKRVASRRVQEILNKLRLLGNCSNNAVYSYSEEDRRKIFSNIEAELKRVKTLFDKPKEDKFSLE